MNGLHRPLMDLDSASVHVWTIQVGSPDVIDSPRRRLGHRRETREAARALLARYVRDFAGDPLSAWRRVERPASGEVVSNLTHSGRFAVLAVTRGRRVGVDLERMRPIRDARALARRFFSTPEAARLERLSADEASEQFFKLWVRKEAYLKGVGGTVPDGLRRFETDETPSGVPILARTQLESGDGSAWTIYDLLAPDGYVAALAIEGEPAQIEMFTT